MKTSAA